MSWARSGTKSSIEVLEEPKKGRLAGRRRAREARVRVMACSGDGQPTMIVVTTTTDGDEEAGAASKLDDDGEPIEDEAEFAATMLDQLLVLMGIEGDVSIRDAETPGDGLGMAKAVLEVEGDDLGVLIGRRGETLTSLQYLLNLMVTRQLGDGNYFTVDIEGYRRRRERQLSTLAQRTAEQVKRTKRPVDAGADAAERAPHHPPDAVRGSLRRDGQRGRRRGAEGVHLAEVVNADPGLIESRVRHRRALRV